MKTQIIEQINNPAFLENAYRKDGVAFKQAFAEAYPTVKDELLAKAWYERLNYKQSDISWGINNEWKVVALLSTLVAFIALVPNFIAVEQDVYYAKNAGFIVFPALMVYFVWKQNQPLNKLIAPLVISIISLLYVNLLPTPLKSDSVSQAFFHLPLFYWAIFGYVYIGGDVSATGKKINFLRFNGDLLVLSGLMLIAGGLFTAITINLFEVLKINILTIYFNYFVAVGLSIVPLFASFLIENNGHLVHKVSPVIARIFTPLATITLLIYLVTIFITGTYPTGNRDYLILFNVLLIVVMALILFSLSEIAKNSQQKFNQIILFVLSVLAIIVNCIALGSILFRISDFGITPNRFAVLGGDILILLNLLIVSFNLFKVVKGQVSIEKLESSIALFLPLYFIWTAFVTFGLPILFQFR